MTLPMVAHRLVACTHCPYSSLERVLGMGQVGKCSKTGDFIPYYDDTFRCPDNRWPYLLTPCGGPNAPCPTPTTETQEKDQIKQEWETASKSLFSMGVEALTSLTSGKASPEVIAQRRASCAACPVRVTDEKGDDYCNDCSCPQSKWWWPVAKLDKKLEFKILRCPRKQPGFSNAVVPK